uniref:Ketoacyl-synt_C domain-containing protein n=1 Tax=Ascaris lumbricoides TaxID=6252 RepID=A0A0M3HXZ4_ASCLU
MRVLKANSKELQICPHTSAVEVGHGKGNDALAAFCRMRRREVRATAALWASAGQPANCVHRGAQAE